MVAATNGNGKPRPELSEAEMVANLRAINDLVVNEAFTRAQLWQKFSDPRRSIPDECGFPASITAEMYQDMYERDAIAARVVEVVPDESWQVDPSVYEAEDPEVVTPFEQAWDALGSSLRGSQYYREEEGSPIWEYLERADTLSGIGSYGVILLGLDDNKDFTQPVRVGQPTKLLYLRCFSEAQAPVMTYEMDQANPRFGQPKTYNLILNDPRQETSGSTPPSSTLTAHWSRVIHLADNLSGNEFAGIPRMKQVWNNIYSTQKVYGSSAEGYWQSCFPGLSFETHPQLGGDVEVNRAELKDMYESYRNGLQRALFLMGMTAKTLPPSVVDPTSQINAQLEAICIKIKCPIRIFKGSERGQLASDQDERAWNKRIAKRHRRYLTPRVIVPFVTRLVVVGVLPVPTEGFRVWWPDQESQTAKEKADVFAVRMGAWAAYIAGGVEAIIPPREAMTLEAGYTDEEADAILTSAAQAAESGETMTLPEEGEAAAEEEAPGLPVPSANEDDDLDALLENAFCPTGSGGGMDNSCSAGGGSGGTTREAAVSSVRALLEEIDTGTVTPARVDEVLAPIARLSLPEIHQVLDGLDIAEKPRSKGAAVGKIRQVIGWMTEARDRAKSVGANVEVDLADLLENAFCPTGEGGGIDTSCSPGGGGSAKEGGSDKPAQAKAKADGIKKLKEDAVADMRSAVDANKGKSQKVIRSAVVEKMNKQLAEVDKHFTALEGSVTSDKEANDVAKAMGYEAVKGTKAQVLKTLKQKVTDTIGSFARPYA